MHLLINDPSASRQPSHRDPSRASDLAVGHLRVLRGWDYAGFGLLTALAWAALAWCLAAWLSQDDWRAHPILLGSLTLLLAYNVAIQQGRWFLLLKMRRPAPKPPCAGWRVGVATTFVPGAESLEMLEVTVHALVALAYPHDTWVLDEGDDPQVHALCTRLGARHFSRKPLAHYQTTQGPFQARSKHGNYNAWLADHGFAQYDLIMNIDPDHMPAPTFLLEVLGYFDDPTLGYVQVAQAYYNQAASFIARGAAEETYAYYSVTQMASYALGFPIVTGCHTTHRATALQQVGGFAAHDADDLLLTFLYRAAGWQGVYVPQILARGLTPVDWAGYLGQQRRWARSVLDIKFRRYPRLAGRLPRRERVLGFLHGLSYLQGLTTGVGIGLLAWILASGAVPQFLTDGTLWRLAPLYAALQLGEWYQQRFFLGGWAECGLHWRAGLLQLAKWPYLGLALLDVLRARQPAYETTPKVRGSTRSRPVTRTQLPVVVLLGLAWLVGVVAGHGLPGLLHLGTAGIVLASIALMATDWWPFPAPYDRRLWERHARGGSLYEGGKP
jgi:Glycosyltransferase like family 2